MSNDNLEKKITSLRRTLSWMDLVMANVNEGILVLDNDWRVVFANSYLAEILGQNRILLLGKHIWEILPFSQAATRAGGRQLPVTKVAKLDGVYDFQIQDLKLKLMFQGKYVDYLKQSVCIISDVSVELKAGDALMALHQEIASLKAQLQKTRQTPI